MLPLPAGMGLLGSLWGIRLDISAPFPRVVNRGTGRACHSFAIAVRSVTNQDRASGDTREEGAGPSGTDFPCVGCTQRSHPSLPVLGKLFFSQKEYGSDAGRRGDAALALGKV